MDPLEMDCSRRALPLLLVCASFASPPIAFADERGPDEVRVDLAGAISLRASDGRDHAGFGGAVEYERRLGRFVGFSARLEGVVFRYDASVYAGPGYATYVGIGPNLRLHLAPSWRRADLYVAGGPELVLTGSLVRAGAGGGIGVDFDVTPSFGIGPFARYAHVFQPNGASQGGQDGRMVLFGVSLSWGAAGSHAPASDATRSDSAPIDATEDAAPTGEPPASPATDSTPATSTEPSHEPSATSRPSPDAGPSGDPRSFGVTLRFESNRATLTDDTVRALRLVRDRLRNEPGIARVLIVGHSDRLGDESYNDDLSVRRAENVLEWLAHHGIARSRLEARGVGFSQPLVEGDTAEDLAPNRRVELSIVDAPSP